MNAPRSPEGEMVDIMDLDREVEALRLGTGRSNDLGLSLLVQLRDDVDRRAATLLGQHDDEHEEWLDPPAAARAPRRRRHHRLAVVPIAGALVLASTGAAAALSGSPHAPLYPLHRLIFGTTSISSAGQVSRDLAEAQILLSRAAAQPYAARADDLAQVRTLLADAQRLLPEAGSSRGQLSIEIAAARARLAQLESPPVAGGTSPTPAPPPSLPSDEGPSATEAPGGESEPSAAASAGGESDAPENVPPLGQARVTEAPETAPSSAPAGTGGWTNDRPTPRESEAPETASAETHTAGSSTVDN